MVWIRSSLKLWYRSAMIRPKIPLLLFILAAILFVISVSQQAPHLPDRVATHFDGQGRVNGWMSRQQHLGFMLAFGLGVPAFVVGLCHLIRFFPSRLLNVPHAEYWRSPEHYPEACRIVRQWSSLLAAWLVLWFASLNHLVFVANQLSPPRLDSPQIFLHTGIFLTGIVILVVRLYQSLRLPQVAVGSGS